MRAQLARRERAYQALRLKLETFDLRRRLGASARAWSAADGRLGAAHARDAATQAEARLRSAAARLDASARWRSSGAATPSAGMPIARASSATRARCRWRDDVRVTLERGELDCR